VEPRETRKGAKPKIAIARLDGGGHGVGWQPVLGLPAPDRKAGSRQSDGQSQGNQEHERQGRGGNRPKGKHGRRVWEPNGWGRSVASRMQGTEPPASV